MGSLRNGVGDKPSGAVDHDLFVDALQVLRAQGDRISPKVFDEGFRHQQRLAEPCHPAAHGVIRLRALRLLRKGVRMYAYRPDTGEHPCRGGLAL